MVVIRRGRHTLSDPSLPGQAQPAAGYSQDHTLESWGHSYWFWAVQLGVCQIGTTGLFNPTLS